MRVWLKFKIIYKEVGIEFNYQMEDFMKRKFWEVKYRNITAGGFLIRGFRARQPTKALLLIVVKKFRIYSSAVLAAMLLLAAAN